MEVKITNTEILELCQELAKRRLILTLAKRKRRILLEELHRQCLEGEVDPKKRMKAGVDRLKKSKMTPMIQGFPNVADGEDRHLSIEDQITDGNDESKELRQ